MSDNTPKVWIGAPVAERAWILPRWFECLRKQTLQPVGFIFIYSKSKDATWDVLREHCPEDAHLIAKKTVLPYYTREQRGSDPSDQWRAQHMSDLRNSLRREFMGTDGEYLFSLDTDILLQDETTIQKLVQSIDPYVTDVVQPLVHLSPLEDQSAAYNAGWLGPGEFDFTQPWFRASHDQVLSMHSPITIEVPMAAVMMRRHVVGMTKYKAHECGEDIGFAQGLKKHKFVVKWRTDIKTRHVWGPQFMEARLDV
jgi:hypothetical protein